MQYALDGAAADAAQPWVPVDGPQTYLTPGSKVNLKLVTCLRVKVTHMSTPRLYVDYELAGRWMERSEKVWIVALSSAVAKCRLLSID